MGEKKRQPGAESVSGQRQKELEEASETISDGVDRKEDVSILVDDDPSPRDWSGGETWNVSGDR